MNGAVTLYKLREHPELWETACAWFCSKWGVPLEAYRASMAAMAPGQPVPQWYLLLEEETIAGGAGVIENDFHDRPNLAPNLCALFVEPAFRGQGLARALLDAVRADLAGLGVETLYLVTGHTEFYERCGWRFVGWVHDPEGAPERMYAAHTPAPGPAGAAAQPRISCLRKKQNDVE